MGLGQLALVGARCCDACLSRVNERLSARGLGLNSSPGQPSRKCVSFLTKQSVERVSGCAHQWKSVSTAGKTTPSS